MNRRRFVFWFSFGLFSLAQKLRVYGLDEFAAAVMGGPNEASSSGAAGAAPVHWRAAENDRWRWFERETMIDGRWTLSGVTTPINSETGEKFTEHSGYLDESAVPEKIRESRG